MMALTEYIGRDERILVALQCNKSFNMDENQTEFGLKSLFDSSNDCKDSKRDEGQDYYFTSPLNCADPLL